MFDKQSELVTAIMSTQLGPVARFSVKFDVESDSELVSHCFGSGSLALSSSSSPPSSPLPVLDEFRDPLNSALLLWTLLRLVFDSSALLELCVVCLFSSFPCPAVSHCLSSVSGRQSLIARY